MLATGAYYSRWHKVYDVQDGCDDLPTVTADSTINASVTYTPINMTVAYIGDSGASQETIDVYEMIENEGAELVIHVGDFDYCDDSTLFGQQLDATLGDIPFLPVVGNHDLHVWGSYTEVLMERWDRTTDRDYLQCEGILFVNYWCVYRGLFIAFSSVGTKCGDGYTDYGWHEEQLSEQMKLSHNYADKRRTLVEPWINCAWHKTQENLQLTDKGDETGYGVYNLCMKEGALIVTGHSHVYGRTHGLGEMSEEDIDVQDDCETELDGICIYNLFDEEAIVSVVGLGGREVEVEFNEELAEAPHWAAKYNEMSGALFCVYNYQGFENLAYCYFKQTNGRLADEFYFTQRGGHPVHPVQE
jgi:predicted phosphodiesterase